jgi:hypothetical protein
VNHLREEDLVLRHYGEALPAEMERHLQECDACASTAVALARDLAAVPIEDVPARGPEYGEEVWMRVAPRLALEPRPARTRPRAVLRNLWVPASVAAALVLAFLLGRHWPQAPPPPVATASAAAGRDRIVLVAVGDHLERSEMLLIELVNAGGEGETVDIAAQQASAEELLGANRLYRQTVARSGEPAVVSLLEELERLLVDVSHRSSSLTPDEIADLRRRIESRGLLFRVRVIETQVREKEKKESTASPVAGKVVS